MTLSNLFQRNEIVHAVDETTAIWEEAKVVGVESDWSVRIDWVNWKGWVSIIFTLPENLRTQGTEMWTIRKKGHIHARHQPKWSADSTGNSAFHNYRALPGVYQQAVENHEM